MAFYKQMYHRMPTTPALSIFPDLSKIRQSPQLLFFQRRIHLKGSTVSFPLGVILLLPLVATVLFTTIIIKKHDSVSNIFVPEVPFSARKINDQYDGVFQAGCLEPEIDGERANATFVVLARNTELDGVIKSLKSIERHFNRWFHYPYVFLNDEYFNSTFKETVEKYVSAPVEWGKINASMWGFPDWVDKDEAKEAIALQGDAAIMYGGLESYHHMCRFYSGFFHKHELLTKYKWYWRVEPDISYFCDITYDPFIHMERANKTYGWTVAVKELVETVPNLFRYASAYKRNNNIQSQGLWEMFLERPTPKSTKHVASRIMNSDNDLGKPVQFPDIDPEAMENERYNMCHFWSNFEIARLDFFRSKAYEDLFNFLDRSGGFWKERWGDAPVHSLAAGILLGKKDVHYFRDFGYRHTTIQHCPANAPEKQLERTPWYGKNTKDFKKAKEEDDYWEDWDSVQKNGVGCRCRCDTDITDIEGKPGSCIPHWVEIMGGWVS